MDTCLSISAALEKFTAANSSFETSRNYVSLSNMILTEDELIDQYHRGFEDGHLMRLRCYKGYQMERDLKDRLVKVFGDRINTTVEISIFDGLIKGHPDFTFDGDPGDCKTVPLDEHMPKDGRVSRKIYAQLQGYMFYMKRPRALALFESRESGIIRDYWINENRSYQRSIDQKCVSIHHRISLPVQ